MNPMYALIGLIVFSMAVSLSFAYIIICLIERYG